MKNVGYMKLWDIDCVCSEDDDAIVVFPINKNEMFAINHLKEENFFIEFSDGDFKTISKIKNISKFDHKLITLRPQYTLRRCISNTFNELEITGDSIDDFFSSTRYFYKYRNSYSCAEKINGVDLLYESVVVDSWEIIVDEKQVKYSLVYGDILSHGVMGNGKLSPKINIKFEETNDYDYVYKLVQIIVKTLKIFGYSNEVGAFNIKAFSTDGGQKSYNCKLHDYDNREGCLKHSIIINYLTCKDYVHRILQFAADDIDFNVIHFQREKNSILSDVYNHLDFINIYNAFEKECNKNKELYIKSNNDKYSDIKIVVNKIFEDIKEKANPEEKQYIEAVKSYAGSYGNLLGQKKRILNSYNVFCNVLSNSLDSIFYIEKNLNDTLINNVYVNTVVKHLVEDLRNGIFHGDFYKSFDEYDSQCIRFLEIIVYCQILKRAGLYDPEIEKIIGEIFLINHIMSDELFNHSL